MASGFWDLVIDRITRTLDGWKKTFLSLGNNNFNSILLVLYPLLFFITFQDSSISCKGIFCSGGREIVKKIISLVGT